MNVWEESQVDVKPVKREVICHYPEYKPSRAKPIDYIEKMVKDAEYLAAKKRACERALRRQMKKPDDNQHC